MILKMLMHFQDSKNLGSPNDTIGILVNVKTTCLRKSKLNFNKSSIKTPETNKCWLKIILDLLCVSLRMQSDRYRLFD